MKPIPSEILKQIDEVQLKNIKCMFLRTWNEIGPDWLALADSDNPNRSYTKSNSYRTVSGSSVQEAVADADRYANAFGVDPGTVKHWRSLPRDLQDKILNFIFPPNERFGY